MNRIPADNYNVGWICALRTEYNAAQLFLDEVYEPREPIPAGDPNVYTLGRIGRHNVVMTVLPDQDNGPVAAVCAATDMQRTFVNVGIVLSVGTGGGAPTQMNDIRLGDVVVSTPGESHSGVFAYTSGKMVQVPVTHFQHTFTQDPPPEFLQTAVSRLKGRYEREGHRIEETIDAILRRMPQLRQEYGRPEPSSDRLYRSTVVHPSNSQADCRVACGNNSSILVSRRQRTGHDDNPKIHYGLIGSSELLMKDALARDQLAQEYGVMCFEKQAKGLMNHFPSLIIRGISNYSDTHNNGQWQGYAAIVAAAYAKDLLAIIPR